MKKLLVTSFALLSLSAEAMNFKAQMQPLRLPLMISTSQPPKVKFTPPGEMSVGLQRMCGDGDVANFEKEHPDFVFVPQSVSELDVIIGYWVVEEGGNMLPTPLNFYPVGYRKSPIAEKPESVVYNGNFLPMNKSFSPGPNGVNLIATDIINLRNIAKRSFGATKNYLVFAGAATCMEPTESSALAAAGSADFKFIPSPVEIGHVLSYEDATSSSSPGLLYLAEKTANSLDTGSDNKIENFVKKNDHVKYKIGMNGNNANTIYKGSSNYNAGTQKPYEFDIGNNGDVDIEKSATDAWAAFIQIAKLPYPDLSSLPNTATDAQKLDAYKTSVASASISSKVSASTSNELSYCANFNLKTNDSAPQYKWEAFPMNLSCKFLLRNNMLNSAISGLYSPTSVPSQSEFEGLKRSLAARFYVAAVFEAVQKSMHSDLDVKVQRSSCHLMPPDMPSDTPRIYSVVGSYPFKFEKTDGHWQITPDSLTHYHPEPGFAIYDYSRYFSSDAIGVWGQVLPALDSEKIKPEDWSLSFPLKDKAWDSNQVDDKTFNSSPINIYFRIRSVGGSCPMYC